MTDGCMEDQQIARPAGEDPESAPPHPPIRGWRRILYMAAAGFFFLLGIIGVLLPIIPATPFLLLTSFFLLKVSPTLNAALLRSRLFGPILVDWQVRGGVRRDIKVKAVVVVSMAVVSTAYLSGYSLTLTAIVFGLALMGIVVIWRLPTPRDSDTDTDQG